MFQNTKFFRKIFASFAASVFSVLSFLLSIIAFVFPDFAASWNKPSSCKIITIGCVFLFLFAFIAILALILTKFKNKNTIWRENEKSVSLIYGDILRIKKSKKGKQFIVIPADTQFMTRVDDDSTKVKNPCVSPESIHGKFIRRYYKTEDEVASLNTSIDDYIKLKEYEEDTEQTNRYKYSLKKRYKIGTLVDIKSKLDDNCHFLLLAMSEYDEEKHAHSSREQLIKSIISLLKFYDENCQGGELYIPLMGMKFSRIDLSIQESLQILRATVEQNVSFVKGNVNIVVDKRFRNNVSIF